MVGQPRRHGRRSWLPALGRAAAVGGLGLRQGQAQAGMWQAEIIIDLIQRQLLPYACLVFAQRGDAPPHRGHMLADAEVQALDERGVDLVAQGSSHRIDGLQGAKHHAVLHPHQAPAPHRLDHLRIQ